MSGPDSITADIQLIQGELLDHRLRRTETGDWLAALNIRFLEKAPVEVSLRLHDAGRQLSEDVRYLCPPTKPEFEFPAVYQQGRSSPDTVRDMNSR